MTLLGEDATSKRRFYLFSDIILLNGLPFLFSAGALVYGLLAISHIFVLHGSFRIIMVAAAGTNVVVSLALRWQARRSRIGPRYANVSFFAVAFIGLVNSHLHLFLTADHSQISNIIILIIGFAFLFVRNGWFLAVLLTAILPWIAMSAVAVLPKDEFVHYAFALGSAVAFSIVIHISARTVLKRLFESRMQLKHALVIAGRRKTHVRMLSLASFEAVAAYHDGKLLEVNPQFEELIGIPQAELIGRDLCEFFSPGEYKNKAGIPTNPVVLPAGAGVSFAPGCLSPNADLGDRGWIRNASGELIPVEVRKTRIQSGERILYMVAFRDARPRLRSELFESFVTKTASKFINVPIKEIDQSVSELLETAGKYATADRAYLFLVDEGGETISNTIEWCREGIAPQIDELQHVPLSMMPWWTEQLNAHREISILDVDKLPAEASVERQILEEQGIRSLFVVGLFQERELLGFIGFDAVSTPRSFPSTEAAILRVVAEMIINVIERRQSEEKLREQDLLFHQLTDNISEAFYIISPTADEVYYLSPAFEQIFNLTRDDVYRNPKLLFSAIVPEDQEVFVDRNRRRGLRVNSVPEAAEFRTQQPDGTIRWIRVRSAPIPGFQGDVERIAGICEDITEEKEREVETERRRTYELELGARIQRTLLNGEIPKIARGVDVGAMAIPSQSIGGDFYEFITGTGYLDLLVGDVMGKGVPAALLSAGVKNAVFRVLRELKAGASMSRGIEPVSIINATSRLVENELEELESFITLSYTRLDLYQATLRLVDCGHTPVLRFSRDRKQVDIIKGTDTPIGVADASSFHEHWVPFSTGDLFLFFSDGVTEARRSDGEYFGEERLVDLMESHSEASPHDLIEYTRDAVEEFAGQEGIRDDFTCVAVRIEADVPVPSISKKRDFPARFEELSAMRSWLEDQLSEVGLGETERYRVVLGVHEAMANSIEHGGLAGGDDIVQLELSQVMQELYITIRDRREFFRDFYFQTDPQPDQERGFGLHIIRSVFDSVSYYTDSTGNNSLVLAMRTDAGEA